MKTILSLILCLTLTLFPATADQQDQPKVVQTCFIEIVIPAVLVLELACYWSGLTKPTDQYMPPLDEPPWLTAPYPGAPTNSLLPTLIYQPDCAPRQTNITPAHASDVYSQIPCEFTNKVDFTVQMSTDLLSWSNCLAVTIWQSANGQLLRLKGETNTVVLYNPQQIYWPGPPPAQQGFFRINAP